VQEAALYLEAAKNAVADFSGNKTKNFEQIFVSDDYEWGKPNSATGSIPLKG